MGRHAAREAGDSFILDSINEGVFTVDLEWNITAFNRAAERITGVSREEAVGRRCWEVLHAAVHRYRESSVTFLPAVRCYRMDFGRR